VYRFFVYHEITDAINTNIIAVMAEIPSGQTTLNCSRLLKTNPMA
jgi:hypothetical protein